MRKIDGSCFSWKVRIVPKVGNSKASACELRKFQECWDTAPFDLRIVVEVGTG